MTKEKEIINKIDNTEEIKRFKELTKIISSNNKYKELIENFNENKDLYIKNDTLNIEIIKLRKELFKIDEVKEYLKLEKEIRLLVKKINNSISSIIDKKGC